MKTKCRLFALLMVLLTRCTEENPDAPDAMEATIDASKLNITEVKARIDAGNGDLLRITGVIDNDQKKLIEVVLYYKNLVSGDIVDLKPLVEDNGFVRYTTNNWVETFGSGPDFKGNGFIIIHENDLINRKVRCTFSGKLSADTKTVECTSGLAEVHY